MKKVLQRLDRYLEEFLLVVFLGAMTLIMGVQVVSRYVFGMSLSWSEEITRYLFIWSGFLSVSYCSKMCISIKIEQFVSKLSRRTIAWVKVFTHTIDAQENPYEVIVSNRLYEQQDYVVETNHLPHLITLIVNDTFYNDLSQEDRQIMDEAAANATDYAREMSDQRIE